MTIVFEERPSDSPYIETVTRGYIARDGSTIRPAECHWHMVFVKEKGRFHPIVTGPLTSSGVVVFEEGAEILWIRFKLGTFMPHLPVRHLIDMETRLPDASSRSFWMKGSAWQFPDFENTETFVDWMVRDELLVCDPVVDSALKGHLRNVPDRTLRHRFQQATGMTQGHIRQIERAQRAAALLEQGVSILDTVYAAGYFDQPHLTKSLKQWVGYTPAQIAQRYTASCQPQGLPAETSPTR